jgi:hypothetical protein
MITWHVERNIVNVSKWVSIIYGGVVHPSLIRRTSRLPSAPRRRAFPSSTPSAPTRTPAACAPERSPVVAHTPPPCPPSAATGSTPPIGRCCHRIDVVAAPPHISSFSAMARETVPCSVGSSPHQGRGRALRSSGHGIRRLPARAGSDGEKGRQHTKCGQHVPVSGMHGQCLAITFHSSTAEACNANRSTLTSPQIRHHPLLRTNVVISRQVLIWCFKCKH